MRCAHVVWLMLAALAGCHATAHPPVEEAGPPVEESPTPSPDSAAPDAEKPDSAPLPALPVALASVSSCGEAADILRAAALAELNQRLDDLQSAYLGPSTFC